jgi:hypothetical protein
MVCCALIPTYPRSRTTRFPLLVRISVHKTQVGLARTVYRTDLGSVRSPKKNTSFTLPHQPRTLEIFNLHQSRTGIFCLTGSKIRQKSPFFNPAPPQ